jgi:hypothetical protein
MARKNYQDWNHEKKYAERAGAVTVPCFIGQETEAVLVRDVLARKKFFEYPGVYIIRDDRARVIYVGTTAQPLRVRLRNAFHLNAKWTQFDELAESRMTVSMICRGGKPDEDRALQASLVEKHNPKFNRQIHNVKAAE